MTHKSIDGVFDKYTDAETLKKIIDYKNIGEMWAHSALTYPDNVAIECGRKVTYKELDTEVAKFRTVLIEKGVKKGDNVGVYMPNGIDFAKAFLAITTLGACAVLLPPHLDKTTVFGCSMKFALNHLVYAEGLAENVGLVKEKNVNVTLIGSAENNEIESPAVDVESEDACTVIFTGGTTGRSKGAKLSHKAIMRGVKNGCYGFKEIFEQRYFLVLPLTHVFGLVRNLLTSLYTGSALYICLNNKNMFREIATFRPTMIVLVPALAEMALNLSKQFGKNMLGEDLKTIVCGAAAVAPYLVKEYAQFGITLLPGYGLTESANLVSGNPESHRKPESVGFIYPGMEYKIVDEELWLKGVNMMDCYVGEPEENAIAYEDGWFKTGDLVKMDDEGFLYITGRKKEIIVLPSGENVSPAELESKFLTIDAIQDCLVYESTESGKSRLVLEILPRAAVLKAEQINDPQEYLTEKVREINATLPSFEKINQIIIRDTDFVRSPSMKIVRSQNGKK